MISQWTIFWHTAGPSILANYEVIGAEIYDPTINSPEFLHPLTGNINTAGLEQGIPQIKEGLTA